MTVQAPHACGSCNGDLMPGHLPAHRDDGDYVWFDCSRCEASHYSQDCCHDNLIHMLPDLTDREEVEAWLAN